MPEERTNWTFIVRLWREPREVEPAARHWRGMVEVVPSGERHFVDGPEQIARVIERLLAQDEGSEEDHG